MLLPGKIKINILLVVRNTLKYGIRRKDLWEKSLVVINGTQCYQLYVGMKNLLREEFQEPFIYGMEQAELHLNNIKEELIASPLIQMVFFIPEIQMVVYWVGNYLVENLYAIKIYLMLVKLITWILEFYRLILVLTKKCFYVRTVHLSMRLKVKRP